MALTDGDHLGHYLIREPLGAGGMGEVYRATDTRLNRDVALKVLPPDLAADAARVDRFKREARAVAALTHPHIVTIYSVEEIGGTHFLTMELVEGRTLAQHIPSGGLPAEEIVDIAARLADALAAAHDKHIIHRDLKPANVMVTRDGRVKILDFGLAKVSDQAPDRETALQTTDGSVLGTVPYMSPEQVEGRAVDPRTDIFSLGVMVYEMATGTRPFNGSSHAALASAILRDAPAPITERRPDLPSGFNRVVDRCLEKSTDRRLQSARDLRNELNLLRKPATGAAGPSDAPRPSDRRAIVVLPFANLSPDADNEYFSDGLTEEIIADLTRVKQLSVVSRTSTMQLKGVKKDLRAIARDLDVRYVLEGSVRKAGPNLRITAQLVDASTDAPLWSDKYSGTIDDVFEVQERVSREIVKALDITLSLDEQRGLAERPIADPRAFELFLQARQELRRYAIDRAASMLEEAIRIEGDTPPLLAMRTWIKVYQIRAGLGTDRSLLDDAERDARALLTRVPSANYGDALLGQIAYERGQLPEAVRHLTRAIDKVPNDSDAMIMLTMTYVGGGQNAAAAVAADRMMSVDPLAPMSWMGRGVPPWFVGRAGDGIADLRRGLEIDPQSLILNWTLGYAHLLTRNVAEASRCAATLDRLYPHVPYTRQLLSLIDGVEGRPEGALARITDVNAAALDAHNLFHLGEAFIWAGDIARGLDLLEQSVEGFYPYQYFADHCWFLDPVRSEPRFSAYLARAKARCDAFPARERELSGGVAPSEEVR